MNFMLEHIHKKLLSLSNDSNDEKEKILLGK